MLKAHFALAVAPASLATSGTQTRGVPPGILSNFASVSPSLHMVLAEVSKFHEDRGLVWSIMDQQKKCPCKHSQQLMNCVTENGLFHSGVSVTFGRRTGPTRTQMFTKTLGSASALGPGEWMEHEVRALNRTLRVAVSGLTHEPDLK